MKLNLDVLPVKYWDMTTVISWLQRRIIVYSIMYYEMSESCISDKSYDELSHQLVELMNSNPQEVLEQTTYWYAMYDFDGSTGFDLPDRLTKSDRDYLTTIASHVQHLYRNNRYGNNKNKRKIKVINKVKSMEVKQNVKPKGYCK